MFWNKLYFKNTFLYRYHDIRAHHYCVGKKGVYDISLDYMIDFIKKYPKNAKLGVAVLSQITQFNYNLLGYMDKSLVSFLKQIHQMPNTILILNSVKGSLIGKLGQTKAGSLEYKRPLLTVYVSNDINQKYSLNGGRTSQIVSPFDVYVTMREVLTGKPLTHKYGLSLFSQKQFSKRDCHTAGVTKQMCPCET